VATVTTASGFAIAAGAAVIFGVSAVLQRAGARPIAPRRPVTSAFLGPVVRRPLFALGVVLDAVGLLGSLAAVQVLPVHVVEALLSSSVAVAAVLATVFLGESLSGRRWVAIGVMAASLVVVARTAAPPSLPTLHGPAVALPLALGVALVAVLRRPGVLAARPPFVVGLLSGASFGMVALAGSILPTMGWPPRPGDVVVAATLAGWAAIGLALFWRGVRVAAVTPVLVGQTVGEALLPSLVAVLLGEPWSTGPWVVTTAAFVAVLASAMSIAAPERALQPV
jgi:hypothetical protein